jgi:hypothetical protein
MIQDGAAGNRVKIVFLSIKTVFPWLAKLRPKGVGVTLMRT